MCTSCSKRISSTAGTIFSDTRPPLTVWFAAAWYLTSQKNGISSLGLQRVLELGSYQTAWMMLHRLHSADKPQWNSLVPHIVGNQVTWIALKFKMPRKIQGKLR